MKGIPKVDEIERKLLRMQDEKDKVMNTSRDLIRAAGKAITLMHAREFKSAAAIMKELRSLEARLKKEEKGFEYYSLQAHQEYVEAGTLYTLMRERRLMSFSEMRVDEMAYVLGVMDLVGELKREIIESLREGKLKDANAYYDFMKDIYDSTRSMKFANSLVPDFRHKQDTARIQVESAGSEILAFESKRKYI
jgi:translin